MGATAAFFSRRRNINARAWNNSGSSNNNVPRSSRWVVQMTTTIAGCSILLALITTRSVVQRSGLVVIGGGTNSTSTDSPFAIPTHVRDASATTTEAWKERQQHQEASNSFEEPSKNHKTPSPSEVVAQESAINFRLDPHHFINKLADCMVMEHDATNNYAPCHILYLHTGKTGGQDVESRMWTLFPPAGGGATTKKRGTGFIRRACCGSDLVKHFHLHSRDYCHAKFSSFEVSGSDFAQDIVPTCLGHYNDDDDSNTSGISTAAAARTTSARNVLVLATFREPIQRTLSYIHQMCNKHFEKRLLETKKACRRCLYQGQDVDFWNGMVATTNHEYQDLWQGIQLLQDGYKSRRRSSSSSSDAATFTNRTAATNISTSKATTMMSHQQQHAIDVLTIDTEDLTSMYGHLYRRLTEALRRLGSHDDGGDATHDLAHRGWNDTLAVAAAQAFAPTSNGALQNHANPERTSRCNFALTSPMLRGLRPSLQIYRNMTLNGM